MESMIVTIKSVNYGNRLQNYAVYHFLEKLSLRPQNLYIDDLRKRTILKKEKNSVKRWIKKMTPMPLLKWNWNRKSLSDHHMDVLQTKRENIFDKFTTQNMDAEYITVYYDRDLKSYANKCRTDYFVAGSDQIWNPDFAGDDYFFLDFAEPHKRIAFAASIGHETLSDDIQKKYADYWKQMQYISVREQSAAELIKYAIGKKVDVFLDPTMLLTQAEWKEVEEKPEFELPKKYALCLFLGNAPKEVIKEYHSAYGMDMIMLNDKAYPEYYLTGPSEFIYLIEHAELVLTDSFHCTVFSIIFHKDFFVFEREDSTMKNMFTRLENLLEKLKFQDRIQMNNTIVQRKRIEEWRFAESDRVMRMEQERTTKIMTNLLQ